MDSTKMPPDAQRLAIALSVGKWYWTAWGKTDFKIFAPKGIGIALRWSGEDKEENSMRWPLRGQSLDAAAHEFILGVVPDFLSDLDAMYAAEKTLKRKQCEAMHGHLAEIMSRKGQGRRGTACDFIWHATAPQRAEAFLRTIGKWEA
jgi:hypothetical protein